MANDKTGIEWCDATWSPVRGCSRVSEGCRFCYAETQAARIIAMDRGRGVPEGQGSYDGLLAKGGQWNGNITLVPDLLDQPLRWKKPRRIFVNSMSDLFHENVPTEFIEQVFAVMALAPQHTFQILTKRPQRMMQFMSHELRASFVYWAGRQDLKFNMPKDFKWPLPNVWLGVSVEDQKTADERIPLLLQTPAAVRWISAEPLLGAIDLVGRGRKSWFGPQTGGQCANVDECGHKPNQYGLNWVVVGGESGKNARPMHPNWAMSLRDQCKAAGVAYLFKQWGEWVPRSSCYHTFEDGKSLSDIDPASERWPCVRLTEDGNNGSWLENSGQGDHAYMQKVGKKMAGRLLDGVPHDDYPKGAAAQGGGV